METQPNLLLVMADQLRADALGVHGNPDAQTPNLDQFAGQAVDVRRYFANSPVCVPSRVSLFTGRYPHSHRVRENHTLPETGQEIHLFRALKQAGYHLGYVGKNHLLNDLEFLNFNHVDLEHGALYPVEETPFHHKYAGEELAYRRFECERLRIMEGRGAYAGASPHNFPEKVTEPHIFTDSALGYLKRRKDAAQPFCLCVSWVQPHAPHIAPDFLHKFYGQRPFRLPEAGPCAEALRQKADRYRVKYQAQRSHLATEAEKRNFIATYYAMVTAIDRQFGRLMEALAALGLEKNTIVVFTSDHGDFLFQNGLCKKDLVMAEALLRVPLLIRWPGRLAPRVADEGLMEAVDVLPTLLEFLGLELPLGVQGASACGYLRGDTAAHKSAVFGEVCAPWQYNPYPTFAAMEADWQEKYHHQAPLNVPGDFTKSVRTPTHRYCWYATGQEELYDLTADPTEEHNLAALPAHRETLAALKLRLFEWCVRSEDPLDPKLCAKNQQRYNRWRFRKPEDGAEGGPVWLEQARAAFCKNQNL